jgi:outer membrane protein TolC
MFKAGKAVRIVTASTWVALLVSPNALAQSEGIQRITFEQAQAQAQAQAGADKVASLARLGIDAARYHRKAVQADYLPKIGSEFFNLHFNKFMGQKFELLNRERTLPLVDKDQTIFVATVTQPVTPLFKVRQAVRIARADEAIAEAKATQMLAQVAANIESIYFRLLVAQRRQADATLTELTQTLNTLIGYPVDTPLELAAPEPAGDTFSLAEATRQALMNSPEVVEAEQTVVKAKAAVRLSKLEYVPDVAVIGGYSVQTAIPALPKDFSFVGVVASLNIFDFGKRENTINESETRLSMAQANLELVRMKVAANARNAFFQLQRNREIRNAALEAANTTKHPRAEADMFQAELDYRSARHQLQQVMDGR